MGRFLAGVLGIALLIASRLWTQAGLDAGPVQEYSLTGFLRLSPGELSFLARYSLSAGAGVVLLAFALAPALDRLAARASRRSGSPWLPLVLAGIAGALVAAVGWGLLQNQVVTDDEYVYRFQAELLRTGRAAATAPQPAAFFENVFVVVRDGRWFGQYSPGFPAVLTVGLLLGDPRIVPVLLAVANVLLTSAVLRRLAGPGPAILATAALVASPLFVLTGATLLSHSTAYFGLVLALGSALRARESGAAGHAALLGLGVGLAFLTRPYTGLTLGLAPAVVLLWRNRVPPRVLVSALGVAALFGALFLAYNHAVTGNAFVTGYQSVRGPGQVEFGFGTIFPGIHDHTVTLGLANALRLATRFHAWSLGWPAFALLILAVGIPGTGRPRESLAVWGAVAALVWGFLSYVPYWSIGVNDTGPVKTYELLLPASILLAVGGLRLSRSWGRGTVLAGGLASTAAALLVFWPPQISHVADLSEHVAAPLRAVEATVAPPALVFVTGMQTPRPRSWVFGRPNPRPDLSDPILYVRDLGPRNRELRQRFPDRRAYRLAPGAAGFEVTPLRGR